MGGHFDRHRACRFLAALWLTFHLRHEAAQVALMYWAAITMGIAIAGMHYAGMKAAQFPMSTMAHHHGINGSWLAVLVSVVALSILGITLLVSMLDARLQARTSLLASLLLQKLTGNWPSWRCTTR